MLHQPNSPCTRGPDRPTMAPEAQNLTGKIGQSPREAGPVEAEGAELDRARSSGDQKGLGEQGRRVPSRNRLL